MRVLFHGLTLRLRPVVGHAMLLAAWVAMWCGLASGCRREPPPPATLPAGVEVTINVKTPTEAARSLLELLTEHLHAVARHDRSAADAYRNLVARKLTAREHIMTRYREITRPLEKDETTVLRTISESWAAIIAYYADGIDWDRITLTGLAGAADEAVVDVPAHGPDDEAIIRMACERDDDGHWSVAALELAPPSEASTQPVRGRVVGDR